jgi:hypothetical protein
MQVPQRKRYPEREGAGCVRESRKGDCSDWDEGGGMRRGVSGGKINMGENGKWLKKFLNIHMGGFESPLQMT